MRLRGSLILEAAYMFPFIILSIFLILLFAYFKHDRIAIKAGMKAHLIRVVSEDVVEDFDESSLNLYYMICSDVQKEEIRGGRALSTTTAFEVLPKLITLKEYPKESVIKEAYKAYRPQKLARRMMGRFLE